MRKLLCLFVGIALALPIILAQVQIQTFISFQGKLANASTGDPMTPASLRINVTEYNNLSSVVWGPVIYNNATDFQGVFDIVLGRNSTLNLTPGKDYQIIVCVDQDAVTYAACDFVYGDGTASGGLIIANAGGIRDASQLFLIDNSTSVQEIINQIITNISNIQGGMSHFFVDTGDIATQNLTTAIILNVSDLYAKTLNVTGNVNVTGAINAYNISNFNARIISLNESVATIAHNVTQINQTVAVHILNVTNFNARIIALNTSFVTQGAPNDNKWFTLNGEYGSWNTTTAAYANFSNVSMQRLNVSTDVMVDAGTLWINSSSNKVGIGNTNPDATLTVGTVASGGSLEIEGGGLCVGSMGCSAPTTTGSALFEGNVLIANDASYNKQAQATLNVEGNVLFNTSDQYFYFETTTGRVGIGTRTPDQKLKVTGDVNVSGTIFAHNYSSNSPITFSNASNGERLAVIDENGNLRVITGGLCVGDGCSAESTPGNAVAQLSIYRNQSAAIEVLRPNGAGTSTQLTKVGAATNWEAVDDEVLNTNDYVNDNAVSAEEDLYAMQDSQIGNGVISSVKAYVVSRGGNNPVVKTMIRTNGVTYYGSSNAPSQSVFQIFSTTYATNPQSGSAWTWSEVNAMEAGVSSYGEEPSLVGTSMIATPNGSRAIKELREGDFVYSYDGKQRVVDVIDAAIIHSGSGLVHIVINNQLDVTANHEVYTTRGYVLAEDLAIGDMLLSEGLRQVPVESLHSYVSNEMVYDLVIHENPNFFADAILVHNAQTGSMTAQVYVEVTYTGPVSVLKINNTVVELGQSRIDTNGSAVFKGDLDVFGSVALGYEAYANDTGAVALGRYANATGQSAVAIGSSAKSNGSTSIAIGTSAYATGTNTLALGSSATVSGSGSVAIGSSANVEATNSVGISIGSSTELTQANTLAIMGGKVGIGTVTPFATLDVAGTVNGTVYYDRDNASFRVDPNNVSEMKRIWVTDTLSVGNGGRHVSYSDAMTQQVSFQILSTRTKPGVEYGFTANVDGTYDDGSGATVTQVYAGDFVATLSDPDNTWKQEHGAAGFTGTGVSPGPATAIGAIGRISNGAGGSPTNGAGVVGYDQPNISSIFGSIAGYWAAWFSGNVYLDGGLKVTAADASPSITFGDGDLYVESEVEFDGLPSAVGAISNLCIDSSGIVWKDTGSCTATPFIFAITEDNQKIRGEELLAHLRTKDRKSTQTIPIHNPNFDKYTIYDPKREVSYIDMLKKAVFGLYLNTSTSQVEVIILDSNLQQLDQIDNDEITLAYNESITLQFEPVPSNFTVLYASWLVNGYYMPDDNISTDEW